MALRVLSSDFVNPEMVALMAPQSAGGPPAYMSDNYTGLRGPAGLVRVTGIPLPGLMAIDMRWQTEEEVILEDETPSQAININFQLKGTMRSRFSGLGHELDMQPGRHNLLFVPDPGDESRVGRQADLEMLHISIDRQHFSELIGSGNAWAERAQRELEAGRPFSGIHGTAGITPAMNTLIRSIRQPAADAGPMQHLLTHARMLELLSLQLNQFVAADRSSAAPQAASVSPADAERLYGLRSYLDTHFLDTDLSLTSLSRRFLLNEFKLKKGFRELFGTTVFGYLKERRMSHAAMLLRDCHQLVEEVAYTLGYEHAHHFTVAFRKHFGVNPGQWSKAVVGR